MNRPTRAQLVTAFAVLYLIWGSTYLGIRFAIESVPPFLMGGTRFLLAGAILFVVGRWRGAAWPTLADLRTTFIFGAWLILFGQRGGGRFSRNNCLPPARATAADAARFF